MLFSLFCSVAMAVTFNFKNVDTVEIISQYAELSKRKITFTPQVQGKMTILNPNPVTVDEAFNDLSRALAQSGFAVVKQPTSENLSVMSSRDAQRNSLEVVTHLPSAIPERLVTYVRTLKYIDGDEANTKIRIFSSKDGEMIPFKNKLIFTDWISNLYRVEKILAEIDVPKSK